MSLRETSLAEREVDMAAFIVDGVVPGVFYALQIICSRHRPGHRSGIRDSITAASEGPNRGSRFVVRFPRSEDWGDAGEGSGG